MEERETSNANFTSSFIGGSSNQVGAATRPYQRIIDDHREAARSLPSSYTTAEDLTATPIPLSRDGGYHNPWAGPPLLAGDVAEAIVDGTAAALPPRDDLLTYLRLAKKDEHGNCDNCKISAMIVDVAPNASDDILADVWLDSYRECVEFFAHPDVCAALDRLAEALREHQLLTGEQIAELVDAEALQAARASLETI